MLKYLASKKELPAEYIAFLKGRHPLADEDITEILDLINAQLRADILELQNPRMTTLRYSINLRQISEKIGVDPYSIGQIVYHHHTPGFNGLRHILQAMGIDPITFFERIEASQIFQRIFRSRPVQGGQRLTSQQRQKMQFIGGRIQQAMDFRRMGSHIRSLTGLRKNSLNNAERDITLPSFVYTSFASEVPLSVLVSSESLRDYTLEHRHSGRTQDEIRAEKESGQYMMRFKKAFMHFLIWKMNKANMSLSELARNSYLLIRTIRSILIEGTLPRYLTLSRMVEEGFGQDLVSFFQEFEVFVEASQTQTSANPYLRFEHAIANYDLNQVVNLREDLFDYGVYRSEIVKNALTRMNDRFLDLESLTFLSKGQIADRTGVKIDKFNNIAQARLKNIIILADLLGITPFQFLGNQPLSELINPQRFSDDFLSRYVRPSDEEIQRAMDRLSVNIQEQRGYDVSDQDLLIRSAARRMPDLNSVLFRENTATLLRLFQITEALAWTSSPAPDEAQTSVIYTPPESSEDFYDMLKILLEGVGTQR